MQDKNPGSAEASARSGAAGSPESNASPWSPLQRAVFRSVWIALVASNIGTWMQSVGAAWLMTSLTPSPLLVALMQTATSLPIFLVGLPAGTLADVVDRRKLLLVTVAWMLLVALGLGVLTLAGLVSAWTLLALTFLLGLGAALNAPAWQAIVPELVDREELPAAVALTGHGVQCGPRRRAGHRRPGGRCLPVRPPSFCSTPRPSSACWWCSTAGGVPRCRAISRPKICSGPLPRGCATCAMPPPCRPSSCASASSCSAPAPCGPCCPSWRGTIWALARPAMESSWAALVSAPWVAPCSCRACGACCRLTG